MGNELNFKNKSRLKFRVLRSEPIVHLQRTVAGMIDKGTQKREEPSL